MAQGQMGTYPPLGHALHAWRVRANVARPDLAAYLHENGFYTPHLDELEQLLEDIEVTNFWPSSWTDGIQFCEHCRDCLVLPSAIETQEAFNYLLTCIYLQLALHGYSGAVLLDPPAWM